MTTPLSQVDRQSTVPFHLKLFYRNGSHHRPDEFPTPSASSLPPHLQIYTWSSCTLRELSHLLVSSLPSLLPSPAVGTRLSFRLIFPDPASLRNSAAPGRYTFKELGSVVVGDAHSGSGRLPDADEEKIVGGAGGSVMTGRLAGEPEKTLADARFVIGDYVSVAVLPMGKDGEAPLPPSGPRGGGGMRAFPDERGSGYGGGGGRRGGGGYRGGGAGGGFGRFGSGAEVPSGEWRRGERIPDGGPRPYGKPPSRRGGY